MPDFRARVRDSLPAAVPPPAGWIPWAGLMQDIRHGARVLRRRRGITLVEMLTMALGIGATTALFSVTYGVLLKPLPWPDSDLVSSDSPPPAAKGREGKRKRP